MVDGPSGDGTTGRSKRKAGLFESEQPAKEVLPKTQKLPDSPKKAKSKEKKAVSAYFIKKCSKRGKGVFSKGCKARKSRFKEKGQPRKSRKKEKSKATN